VVVVVAVAPGEMGVALAGPPQTLGEILVLVFLEEAVETPILPPQ